LLGLAVWIYVFVGGQQGFGRAPGILVGWVCVVWGALRLPDGCPVFFGVAIAFALAHLIVPSARVLWNAPRRPKKEVPAPPIAGSAMVLILLGALSGFSLNAAAPPVATQVVEMNQKARATGNYVVVNATMTWKAESGQRIAFLRAPGVLTRIDLPQSGLRLEPNKDDASACFLSASETGIYKIAFDYQIQIASGKNGFSLATPSGVVNGFELTVEKADVEVLSESAVSIQTTHADNSTQARIVLSPAPNAAIAWRPRPRDTRNEKAVFYAEFAHLYIPAAGAVEGSHEAQIRPAQGQLDELSFDVPEGLTITDAQSPLVSNWRFDPDRRVLRVQFTRPQSRPFALRLRSQHAAAPLPYLQTNGVISARDAAGQVGVAGIATGGDVQLDSVIAPDLSVINLEDFPAQIVADAAAQIPGLAVRRAFRYSAPGSKLVLSASAVRPDIRVDSQDTLSLGEDRALLSSQLSVHIARAGIFKLSFALPADFEIESLTGPALSHWTEVKEGTNRVITMNLRGKTEGAQAFSVALSGPGIGRRAQWEAPRLSIREAAKQTGLLVLAPELGTRLHVNNPDGVSQLDPKKAGAQQQGALAFRLLRADWKIPFEIETVEPWIQVSSLQDATFREGQARIAAQLDFQIENAGVKSLLFQIPARAENVRFEGELIADSSRLEGAGDRADWELKLQRRVIGAYTVLVTYQLSLSNQADTLQISSVNVKNANLQRAWLSLRPTGRLQIEIPNVPAALQRAEWQSIPASLRRNREITESKDTFSALESSYELPITLSRHEVAKVLPARVESADLTSVLAPGGEVLTEGRLLLRPGDKRLLRLKLPSNGKFWYAFVNGQSASPWREDGEILLLLEKNSNPARPTSVEFFYTSPVGTQGAGKFNAQLSGPSFDLPLENITWQVYLPGDQALNRWQSSLQLVSDVLSGGSANLDAYLKNENARVRARSTEAESMLQMGNNFLVQGTPRQARQAYNTAWKLSPQDAALNEDARVQLHNLKTQQALLGLNQRRLDAFEQQGGMGGKSAKTPFDHWEPGQAPDYTQQQAQEALEQNPAEDNTALMKLAERVVSQQDAGTASPDAIRAALPMQGRQLIFKGSLQVNEWADMQIKLDTRTERQSWSAAHVITLFAALACLGIFLALSPRIKKN
jgi:hypothetical protein